MNPAAGTPFARQSNLDIKTGEVIPPDDRRSRRRAWPGALSVPVVVLYTRDFQELHRYIEYPAIYHKDRIRGHQQAARPGETEEQTKERGMREFAALQASPFFDLWASAGIDEILSALHDKASAHLAVAGRPLGRRFGL